MRIGFGLFTFHWKNITDRYIYVTFNFLKAMVKITIYSAAPLEYQTANMWNTQSSYTKSKYFVVLSVYAKCQTRNHNSELPI